jgi:outer membrane protein assembly factor BamB
MAVSDTQRGSLDAGSYGDTRVRRTGATLPKHVSPAGDWDFFVSSPVVVDQTIVIRGGDGNVYALDLTTGKERWRVKTGGKVRATPSVKAGVVVVGARDGRVYAIELATGRTRWVHRTVGDTLDLKGKTTAWVRVYRADRPGSGFVQLWGLAATLDRLPIVSAVAEYGLLRKAGGVVDR